MNDKNLVLRSRVKEVSALKCKKQVQRFLIYKYKCTILYYNFNMHYCAQVSALVRVHLVDTNKALISFNLQYWVCNVVSASNLMLVHQH